MPKQTFTATVSFYRSDLCTADISGVKIIPSLVEGGGTAYVRHLLLGSGTGGRILFSRTDSGGGGEAGPDLTQAWEQHGEAITIAVIESGVTVASNTFGLDDSTEPYDFTYRRSSADPGVFEHIQLGTVLTITLDDGAFHEVTAGSPTYSAQLETAPYLNLGLSFSTNGFIQFSVASLDDINKLIAHTVSAGDPTYRIQLLSVSESPIEVEIETEGPSTEISIEAYLAPSVPLAVDGLAAQHLGGGRVGLYWNESKFDGGADITGWKIEESDDGETWTTLVADTGSADREYIRSGLTSTEVDENLGWSLKLNQNPAWAYTNVLIGKYSNANYLKRDRLFLEEIKAWADENEKKKRYFNYVFDTSTTRFEALQTIASAGRATFNIIDGKYTIVRDLPQTVPVQIFTPENMWDYSGEKAFLDNVHGMRVRYADEENDYKENEIEVYDDLYDEFSAEKYETLELPGLTNKKIIWEEVRYHMAAARLRPEIHKFNTDAEGLVCTRGDLIYLMHDVPLIGLYAMRLYRIGEETADYTEIRVQAADDKMGFVAEKTYGIQYRVKSGKILRKKLWKDSALPGEYLYEGHTFRVEGKFTDEDRPQPQDMIVVGEYELETLHLIVKKIEPFGGDLNVKIEAVDAAPGVHNAEEVIPAFRPFITTPVVIGNEVPPVPIVVSIRSDESVLEIERDGSIGERLVVELRLPFYRSLKRLYFQGEYRELGQERWESSSLLLVGEGTVRFFPVQGRKVYQMRFRTVDGFGINSKWSEIVSHEVVGKTSPPPDVDNFLVERMGDGTRLFTWEMARRPLDLAGFRIKYKRGSNFQAVEPWDELTPLHTGLIEAEPYETNLLSAGNYYIAIKAVDTVGNESVNAASIVSSIGDPRLGNSLFQTRPRFERWPGTKDKCIIDENNELVADDKATWADLERLDYTWDEWESWAIDPEKTISYTHTIDLGSVVAVTLDVKVEVEGTVTVQAAFGETSTIPTNFVALDNIERDARTIAVKVTVVQPTGSDVLARIKSMVIIVYGGEEVKVVDYNDIDMSTLTGIAGERRLDVNNEFSQITSVMLALQGEALTWELYDRIVNPGPAIIVRNADRNLVDVTIDAVVRGYGPSETPATIQRPGAPTDPTFLGLGSENITALTSPTSGGTPTEYEWFINPLGRDITNHITIRPRYSIPNIVTGTVYYVQVRAINSAGNSGFSAISQFTT